MPPQVAASAAVGVGAFVYHRRSTASPLLPAVLSPYISSISESVAMPLIKMLDPEQAHRVAIVLAKYGLVPTAPDLTPEEAKILSTPFSHYVLSSPLVCAAGFDKQVRAHQLSVYPVVTHT
jgi:hypothetical protein